MIYKEKDVIEKSFDDLKNELDMKRLRIHNSQRMKGRTFIQFIALIFLAQIRKTMWETPLTKEIHRQASAVGIGINHHHFL